MQFIAGTAVYANACEVAADKTSVRICYTAGVVSVGNARCTRALTISNCHAYTTAQSSSTDMIGHARPTRSWSLKHK